MKKRNKRVPKQEDDDVCDVYLSDGVYVTRRCARLYMPHLLDSYGNTV